MKLSEKILKEGTIHMQGDTSEWIKCDVIVTERGIRLAPLTNEHNSEEKSESDVVVYLSSREVVVTMLPDEARRSRESKLFPFAVRKKIIEDGKNASESAGGLWRGTVKDEVILATSNGREMWKWASCIRWLGMSPTEEMIPQVMRATTINSHDRHYEDAEVLQNKLLDFFHTRAYRRNLLLKIMIIICILVVITALLRILPTRCSWERVFM